MSYSYYPVAMFGIQFNKHKEYCEFLDKYSQLAHTQQVDSTSDIEEIYSIIETEMHPLNLERLNMFTKQDAILGFPMQLGETVDKYQALWNTFFPNSPLQPGPILSIRVW
jgi:hypothetical protein